MLSLLAIFCSIFVVTAPSTILSIVWLVTLFIIISLVLGYIGLTYAALTYIIVYVGAIAILFLFVVQLLDQRTLTSEASEAKNENATSTRFLPKNWTMKGTFKPKKENVLTVVPNSIHLKGLVLKTHLMNDVKKSNEASLVRTSEISEQEQNSRLNGYNLTSKWAGATNLTKSIYSVHKGLPFSIILAILFIGVIGVMTDIIPSLENLTTYWSKLFFYLSFQGFPYFSLAQMEGYLGKGYGELSVTDVLDSMPIMFLEGMGANQSNISSLWTSLSFEPYFFIKHSSSDTNSLWSASSMNAYNSENLLTYKGQIQNLGQWLYGVGTIALIITSVILLLAMIGPILLCWSYL